MALTLVTLYPLKAYDNLTNMLIGNKCNPINISVHATQISTSVVIA
jgi:hypothetical protein